MCISQRFAFGRRRHAPDYHAPSAFTCVHAACCSWLKYAMLLACRRLCSHARYLWRISTSTLPEVLPAHQVVLLVRYRRRALPRWHTSWRTASAGRCPLAPLGAQQRRPRRQHPCMRRPARMATARRRQQPWQERIPQTAQRSLLQQRRSGALSGLSRPRPRASAGLLGAGSVAAARAMKRMCGSHGCAAGSQGLRHSSTGHASWKLCESLKFAAALRGPAT